MLNIWSFVKIAEDSSVEGVSSLSSVWRTPGTNYTNTLAHLHAVNLFLPSKSSSALTTEIYILACLHTVYEMVVQDGLWEAAPGWWIQPCRLRDKCYLLLQLIAFSIVWAWYLCEPELRTEGRCFTLKQQYRLLLKTYHGPAPNFAKWADCIISYLSVLLFNFFFPQWFYPTHFGVTGCSKTIGFILWHKKGNFFILQCSILGSVLSVEPKQKVCHCIANTNYLTSVCKICVTES